MLKAHRFIRPKSVVSALGWTPADIKAIAKKANSEGSFTSSPIPKHYRLSPAFMRDTLNERLLKYGVSVEIVDHPEGGQALMYTGKGGTSKRPLEAGRTTGIGSMSRKARLSRAIVAEDKTLPLPAEGGKGDMAVRQKPGATFDVKPGPDAVGNMYQGLSDAMNKVPVYIQGDFGGKEMNVPLKALLPNMVNNEEDITLEYEAEQTQSWLGKMGFAMGRWMRMPLRSLLEKMGWHTNPEQQLEQKVEQQLANAASAGHIENYKPSEWQVETDLVGWNVTISPTLAIQESKFSGSK